MSYDWPQIETRSRAEREWVCVGGSGEIGKRQEGPQCWGSSWAQQDWEQHHLAGLQGTFLALIAKRQVNKPFCLLGSVHSAKRPWKGRVNHTLQGSKDLS